MFLSKNVHCKVKLLGKNGSQKSPAVILCIGSTMKKKKYYTLVNAPSYIISLLLSLETI